MTEVQKRFLSYMQAQVGQPYVWGGTGERLTPETYEAFIDRKERTKIHNANAKDFCRRIFGKGVKTLAVFDCSGYVSKALMAAGLRKSRRDCDGLWDRCIPTDAPGDFTLLFRVSQSNPSDETHVGVYYGGYQYHAKGRAYGVVKEPYKASYWHKMGVYPGLSEPLPEGTAVFTRILKRPMLNDCQVCGLKCLLIARGYTGITAGNGNYLLSTERTVRQFQKDQGLNADGIAGKRTLTALGGVWRGA